MAIESRLLERLGLEVQTIWSDDGIAIRLPEGDASLDGIEDLLFPDADEVEDLVVGQVATSSLFASRFRENAARALLLPRRRPGTRTPLWQQRQRAADLLAVASRYGSFPILVETYRECLSDVFDLPALREVLAGVARREIAVHGVETQRASPFASSLLFDYVAAYMYDGDAPLAERRAGALTLDRDLLRELLGQEELRELLDPDALADLELSLQALTDDRRATTVDGLHDLLRRLGDLSDDEVAARVEDGAAVAAAWLDELASGRRAIRTRIAGEDRWIAIEDVARYRDGVGRLGTGRRAGGVPRPGERRARRAARAMGPDPRAVPDARAGSPLGPARSGSSRTPSSGCWSRARSSGASSGRAARSANGATRMCCACSAVGRSRGCAARSSRSTRPRWAGSCRAGMGSRRWAVPAPRSVARRRLERLAEVVDQLAGLAIPASVLERDVLPARIPGYQPRLLDELGSLGEVAWVGRGSLGRDDGRIVLVRPGRDALRPVGIPDGTDRPDEPRHDAIREHLATRGASFYRDLHRAAGGGPDREVLDALWDLVWAGEVTNDTFAPLRALRWKRSGGGGTRRARPGRLTALGPPEAAGRWSLVEPPSATPTERLHAQSLALLERHGVLTREAVAAEGLDGGFSAVYPVLRALEEAGRIRRGYFVDGLGAAQFALAGRPRPVARGARRDRASGGGRGPGARCGGPGQPVRRGPGLAAARRPRPATDPARRRGVRRARRRRRGAVPGARRRHAPDARSRGRPRDRAGRRGGAPRSSSRRPAQGAGHQEGRRRGRGRVPVPRAPAGRRVRARLPRPRRSVPGDADA